MTTTTPTTAAAAARSARRQPRRPPAPLLGEKTIATLVGDRAVLPVDGRTGCAVRPVR